MTTQLRLDDVRRAWEARDPAVVDLVEASCTTAVQQRRHLRERGRERGFAVVDVTDGADIDVLFDGHDPCLFLSSCWCSEHRQNLLRVATLFCEATNAKTPSGVSAGGGRVTF